MRLIYTNEKHEPSEMYVDADTPEGVCFDGMHLHVFSGAALKFNGASFVSCYLGGAYMFSAEIMHVDFTNSVMAGARLDKAKACGSIFRNCDMTGGYFEGADFSGSDLSSAKVLYADFTDCNLRGAIMLGEEIEDAVFTGAKFDGHTVWPEQFHPLEHGAILVEDEDHLAPVEDSDVR